MPVLSENEIKDGLSSLSGWEFSENAISKKFVLPSFMEAIAFVGKVADLAEAADHHPDVLIQYKNVTLTLSTHSEGGVTGNDLSLAKGIESV